MEVLSFWFLTWSSCLNLFLYSFSRRYKFEAANQVTWLAGVLACLSMHGDTWHVTCDPLQDGGSEREASFQQLEVSSLFWVCLSQRCIEYCYPSYFWSIWYGSTAMWNLLTKTRADNKVSWRDVKRIIENLVTGYTLDELFLLQLQNCWFPSIKEIEIHYVHRNNLKLTKVMINIFFFLKIN